MAITSIRYLLPIYLDWRNKKAAPEPGPPRASFATSNAVYSLNISRVIMIRSFNNNFLVLHCQLVSIYYPSAPQEISVLFCWLQRYQIVLILNLKSYYRGIIIKIILRNIKFFLISYRFYTIMIIEAIGTYNDLIRVL